MHEFRGNFHNGIPSTLHDFSPFRLVFSVVAGCFVFSFFPVDFVAIVFAISARHERRTILTLWSLVRVEFPHFIRLHCAIQCWFVFTVWFSIACQKSKTNQIKRRIKTVSEDSVRFFILCEYLRLSNKISHWNGQIAARLFAHHEHNKKKKHFPYYDELLHFSDLFYQ